ncbi:MAG: glutathione S-transferase family protein [Pararhizobium sp.]
MANLSAFPITKRWPASKPDVIQLYSFPTPNGVKISIALEELGLPYEAHRVSLADDDQKTPEFLSLNPNGKIPAIIDPDGPDGEPIGLFESAAILIHLAEKTGRLMPAKASARLETIEWLAFQVAGIGPMFGQFGHFHRLSGDKDAGSYPKKRYAKETRRLLGVLEGRLQGRDWIMGDVYTIADIATFPWVRALSASYEADEILGLDAFPRTMDWVGRCEARPASQKGLNIPPR